MGAHRVEADPGASIGGPWLGRMRSTQKPSFVNVWNQATQTDPSWASVARAGNDCVSVAGVGVTVPSGLEAGQLGSTPMWKR